MYVSSPGAFGSGELTYTNYSSSVPPMNPPNGFTAVVFFVVVVFFVFFIFPQDGCHCYYIKYQHKITIVICDTLSCLDAATKMHLNRRSSLEGTDFRGLAHYVIGIFFR